MRDFNQWILNFRDSDSVRYRMESLKTDFDFLEFNKSKDPKLLGFWQKMAEMSILFRIWIWWKPTMWRTKGMCPM